MTNTEIEGENQAQAQAQAHNTGSRPESSPVLVGVLYDFPQADRGALFEEALLFGIEEIEESGRLDRPVELMPFHAKGLPGGTAHDVEVKFTELVESGCLIVVGPSVSDNGIVVRDLADAAGIPCINYTGGELTRSRYMFHYQVGSLNEEPIVLAREIALRGHSSVALAHDHSAVGRGYAQAFSDACALAGIEIAGSAAVPPLADDLQSITGRLLGTAPDAVVYLGLGVAAQALGLALEAEGRRVPVFANSALMFAYAAREWRSKWDGWLYVDTLSDHNTMRQKLAVKSRRCAAGPIGVAAFDIGRLVGEAVSRAAHLTRHGVRDSLESVKQLPAASGLEGTTMGFGNWDHGALKGSYLVLRSWRDGKTVEVEH